MLQFAAGGRDLQIYWFRAEIDTKQSGVARGAVGDYSRRGLWVATGVRRRALVLARKQKV